MRTLYLLVVINIALILSACATTDTTPMATNGDSTLSTTTAAGTTTTPPKCHHHKDPLHVSLMNGLQQPSSPYQVLGEAKVSKFNTVGIKRQEATMRDLIRQQAASLGGDAVINFRHDDKTISATIIAYKRVLV